jgi:hypothetical protein
MNYEDVKARFVRYLTHGARDEVIVSELYHDDALLEFPQSGERFRGKDNFIPWRSEYPARTEFELRAIRGEGDVWIAEGRIRYDDGDPLPFVDILHFRDDLVGRETIYVTQPFPPNESRARFAEHSELDTTPGLPVLIRTGD